VRSTIVLAVLLSLTGCPGTGSTGAKGPDAEIAPPSGKSFKDYLRSGRPSRPADTVESDKMTMHVIDIGQGLSTLFEFPCGAILVDTGGEENEAFNSTVALTKYLDKFFARRSDLNRTLDALIITHPHIDHTRGIDAVVVGYTVRNVITNGQEFGDLGGRPQLALHSWVAQKNKSGTKIGFEQLAADEIPSEGLVNEVVDPISGCDASAVDPKIVALWGQVLGDKDFSDNPNDHSVVFRLDFGDASIMMTGDLELEGLDHLSTKFGNNPEMLDVDVYLVGHHGSKNSTAPHLVRAMSPKIAVLSAGPYERNYPWIARKFGHPNMRVIDQLVDPNFGVAWYRDSKSVMIGVSGAWKNERKEVFKKGTINRAVYATAWDGTVDVNLYSNGWLEVETERP